MADADYFQTERQAWTAGVLLLSRLRSLRVTDLRSAPDDAHADQMIVDYARRVRRSQVTLSAMQRIVPLAPWDLMVIVYAMANYLGVVRRGDAREMLILAHGADLRRYRGTHRDIQGGVGVGRLVYVTSQGPWPSSDLLAWATMDEPIRPREISDMIEVLDGKTLEEEP